MSCCCCCACRVVHSSNCMLPPFANDLCSRFVPNPILYPRYLFPPLESQGWGTLCPGRISEVKGWATRPDGSLDQTRLVFRIVREWGTVPCAFIRHVDMPHRLYGYIGLEDYTMDPLLPPGTFVEIDPLKKLTRKNTVILTVLFTSWTSEIHTLAAGVKSIETCCCCIRTGASIRNAECSRSHRRRRSSVKS